MRSQEITETNFNAEKKNHYEHSSIYILFFITISQFVWKWLIVFFLLHCDVLHHVTQRLNNFASWVRLRDVNAALLLNAPKQTASKNIRWYNALGHKSDTPEKAQNALFEGAVYGKLSQRGLNGSTSSGEENLNDIGVNQESVRLIAKKDLKWSLTTCSKCKK